MSLVAEAQSPCGGEALPVHVAELAGEEATYDWHPEDLGALHHAGADQLLVASSLLHPLQLGVGLSLLAADELVGERMAVVRSAARQLVVPLRGRICRWERTRHWSDKKKPKKNPESLRSRYEATKIPG